MSVCLFFCRKWEQTKCYGGRNKILSSADIHQFELVKYFVRNNVNATGCYMCICFTFRLIDRNTVVVLIQYASLNVYYYYFIQCIVMCTRLSIVKEIRNYYTIAFLIHSHKLIQQTDSVSKCKTNMPQNNFIIVDFLIDLSPSRKTRIDNWT